MTPFPMTVRRGMMGPVIHEVDESLRLLMRQEALEGADVEIVFDAPTKEWASRRNTPTINVYLYDIREDLSRAHEGIREVRNDSGQVVARKPPPAYFRLSYLITAWTQRPEDEHRLLSACLAAFIQHRTIPEDKLVGSLQDLDLTVPLSIAMPPPQDRSISDIWTALGGELKPSLDLVVSAPMELGIAVHVGPPLAEVPIIGLRKVEPDTEVPGLRRPSPDGAKAKGKKKGKEQPEEETPAAREGQAEEVLQTGAGSTGRVFKVLDGPPWT
jgi:hypothetical protein